MDSLVSFLKKLLQDLDSLPEDDMKLALLRDRLGELDPTEISKLLDLAYRNGKYKVDIKKFLALIVRPGFLEEALGSELFKKTYMSAMELNLEKVSRLFTSLPASKNGLSGYSKEEELKMEYTTLGERRALAKSNVKDSLERLMSDPDPIVVAHLLTNPRIVEVDVVRLIAKRPNSGKILELIASHSKWSKRYAIRKSLVLNPYTPTRVSTGLIEFMMTQDIRLVLESKSLHRQLKVAGMDILKDRNESVTVDVDD